MADLTPWVRKNPDQPIWHLSEDLYHTEFVSRCVEHSPPLMGGRDQRESQWSLGIVIFCPVLSLRLSLGLIIEAQTFLVSPG